MKLRGLLMMMYRHWQWFLLSVVICLSVALLHVKLSTPVYEVSARMLISNAKSAIRSNRMMANIQTPGTVTSTSGIEEEIQKIWTTTLMKDVARSLKLYTEYRVDDWPRSKLVYGNQPVSVDIDPVHLDSLDQVVYEAFNSIVLKLSCKSPQDSGIIVRGLLLTDDEPVAKIRRRFKSLPASMDTPFGTLTFTRNIQGVPMTPEQEWTVTIMPMTYTALTFLGKLGIEPAKQNHSSDRFLLAKYYKKSYVAKMTVADQDINRATDILKQVEISYNRLATQERNEVAQRTAQFINERIVRISEEVDMSDAKLGSIKQGSGMTALADAAQALKGQNQFEADLTEASAQIQLLDYLTEYVDAPENRYAIIPSGIGLTDGASKNLISRYNKTIMERNRLLKSASEESPQVKLLSSTADELSSAIDEALRHSRQTMVVNSEGVRNQYNKYSGMVEQAPVMERALAEEGRTQAIKTKLYLLLLQKREENSIILASEADNGRLIDVPLYEGQKRPRLWLNYGVGLAAGIAIPYAIIMLMGLLRYKIESHEEVESLTELPIIADIPLAENVKQEHAGIVVQRNRNDVMDDVFRTLRSNIFFMLKDSQHTILFTSSTSGEGKSFVAANLAVSYATLGKRVLLCGLDIRKPALGALFGLADRSKGITNLLAMTDVDQQDILQQIQPSGVDEHLDLLLAGPIPPNPPELLARESFEKVISLLKANYDYVILDTAPVGLVTDTLQISRFADLSIYLCRVAYTPKRNFTMVNSLAEEQKLPNPCIVVNASNYQVNTYNH